MVKAKDFSIGEKFAKMIIEDLKKGNFIIKDGDLYLKGINEEIRITRRTK